MPHGETLETRHYDNTTPNRVPASPEVQAYQVNREAESITQQAAAERLRELQAQQDVAATEAQELATTAQVPERSDAPEELAMTAEELSGRIIGLGVNLSHYRYNAQMGAESQN